MPSLKMLVFNYLGYLIIFDGYKQLTNDGECKEELFDWAELDKNTVKGDLESGVGASIVYFIDLLQVVF